LDLCFTGLFGRRIWRARSERLQERGTARQYLYRHRRAGVDEARLAEGVHRKPHQKVQFFILNFKRLKLENFPFLMLKLENSRIFDVENLKIFDFYTLKLEKNLKIFDFSKLEIENLLIFRLQPDKVTYLFPIFFKNI
jgi:hypothetical protein